LGLELTEQRAFGISLKTGWPMVGRTISHYEILEKLGEGGMGVVYKARDTHLDRFVAIKVLPPEKVADAERKRRFVQEAKSASALNHPNIITIYDIANENGIDFIAMEYVPGKALSQVITRKGLPLGEALKYAVQIADALAAAHAAGIIHRDLKPGNVMVSGAPERSGFVKVLDFGLAKLTDKVDSSEREFTETIRQVEAPSTGEGTIVGTVSYMSPEQAEGKKVDGRSDIFSFGALLYEMVTGRRAFHGDSKLSTLSAILREEPKPASEVVEGLPRELERIITRCLRKHPERRFQAMPDLKVALEELKEESDSGTLSTGRAPQRRRDRRLGWAAALLAVTAGGAGALWFFRPTTKAIETPLAAVPLTTYPGFQGQPSLSPDGNQVAFVWNGEKQDNLDIYVKLIGTAGTALRLTTDPARDYSPAWSPDGRYIAFLRDLANGKSAVLLVSALGGPERKIAEVYSRGSVSIALPGPYLSWLPDGNSLVFSDRVASTKDPFALFLLSIDTGERRRLTSPPDQMLGDSGPTISPDGRMLAFARVIDAGVSALYLLAFPGSLKSLGEVKRLTFGNQGVTTPVWTADGHEIVFADWSAGSSLWRVAASSSTGQPAEPRRLASLGTNIDHPAISPHGNRLAYAHEIFHTSIVRIAAPGAGGNSPNAAGTLRLLISSSRDDDSPQFSPDGKRIAFVSARSGNAEVWVCNSDGSNAVQLTSFGGPFVTTPRWSSDGERIAFDSNASGGFDIWVVAATGGKAQRMTTHPANDGNPSWSHDGRWIYFDSARTGVQQVFKLPANGGDAIQMTQDGGFAPLESPDGKYLYYTKALAATSLWKIPNEGGQATKILDGLNNYISLAIVNNGLYFVPREKPTSIRFLSFATNQIKPVADFQKPIEVGPQGGGVSVSPDGRWILCTQVDQAGGELMLVENFR
jgi:Tol biopolymer transport system component/serine/threonine protein kinase